MWEEMELGMTQCVAHEYEVLNKCIGLENYSSMIPIYLKTFNITKKALFAGRAVMRVSSLPSITYVSN